MLFFAAVRRMASSGIIAGALLASSAVVAQAQPTTTGFFGNGGSVSVKYVFSSAADNDQLYYRIGNANPMGDYGFSSVFAAYTILTGFSTGTVASNQQINIGPVCAGCEVVFLLRNSSVVGSFYTGAASRSTDATLPGHVSLLNASASGGAAIGGSFYTTKFGFEDRPLSNSDRDYNDLQIEVAAEAGDVGAAAVVPEPSSYALMASGLLALGFAARRRRKV